MYEKPWRNWKELLREKQNGQMETIINFKSAFPPNPERASLVSFIVHTPSISLTKKKEKPSIPNLRFVIFIIFFPKILSITVYWTFQSGSSLDSHSIHVCSANLAYWTSMGGAWPWSFCHILQFCLLGFFVFLVGFCPPVFLLNPEEFYRVFWVGFVVKLLSFRGFNWASVELPWSMNRLIAVVSKLKWLVLNFCRVF